MDHLLQILMVSILAGTLLKLSFMKLWQVCLAGVAWGAFVVATCRPAVSQSKTALTALMESAHTMQDMAVLVTVESALFFAFALSELRTLSGPRAPSDEPRRAWWRPVVRHYPGLLALPVLFYLQTQLIFARPGGDFAAMSWWLAVGVAVAVPTASYVVRRLYPEKEARLEAHLVVSIFVCALGLAGTVNGHVAYSAAPTSTDPRAVALAAALFAVLFAAGIVVNKIKWTRKWK